MMIVGGMKKALLATSIIMLLFSVVAGLNHAEAASKPSVPEFTLTLQNDGNVQLVIENQPFTQSSAVNSLVYYYKVKDHYSEAWMKCGNYQLQSDGANTLITARLNTLSLLGNATSLDFQVQAVTGYYAVTNKTGGPALMPSVQDWHTEITFNPSETGDWSNIQTINVHSDTASPSTNPIQTPTPEPTQTPASTPSPSPSATPAITQNPSATPNISPSNPLKQQQAVNTTPTMAVVHSDAPYDYAPFLWLAIVISIVVVAAVYLKHSKKLS
jgi:hypothetical protein